MYYCMEVMWWWYGSVLYHGGDVMVVWEYWYGTEVMWWWYGSVLWHGGELVVVWECWCGMEGRWWWYGSIDVAWWWGDGGMGVFHGMEVRWWYGSVWWHGGELVVVWLYWYSMEGTWWLFGSVQKFCPNCKISRCVNTIQYTTVSIILGSHKIHFNKEPMQITYFGHH